ncbi:MAG TPA: hypothetical protein PLA05_01760 [bacterium]|jgi:TRAP-type C4-dicarboxylate transport system permease small subunit|nr:MAG: hypothetical protein BWX82_00564 [Parcubacteria group bacterium ADurb.Bin115]HNU81643.1 hypothetical protein [bacterium]HPW05671.1 hypothetical protein [bacterium]HPY99241.1 hypothetical protein [bacterium]HQB76619.1 hypothetical protein [bacterium]
MSARHKINIIIIALTLFIFTGALSVAAQEQTNANLKTAFDTSSSSALGIVSGAGGAGYNNNVVLETVVGRIITGLFSLLGVIFIIFIIYGGYLYLTASGNEEQTKKATSIITQNIVGLVIILGAYALTYFIIKFFI